MFARARTTVRRSSTGSKPAPSWCWCYPSTPTHPRSSSGRSSAPSARESRCSPCACARSFHRSRSSCSCRRLNGSTRGIRQSSNISTGWQNRSGPSSSAPGGSPPPPVALPAVPATAGRSLGLQRPLMIVLGLAVIVLSVLLLRSMLRHSPGPSTTGTASSDTSGRDADRAALLRPRTLLRRARPDRPRRQRRGCSHRRSVPRFAGHQPRVADAVQLHVQCGGDQQISRVGNGCLHRRFGALPRGRCMRA